MNPADYYHIDAHPHRDLAIASLPIVPTAGPMVPDIPATIALLESMAARPQQSVNDMGTVVEQSAEDVLMFMDRAQAVRALAGNSGKSGWRFLRPARAMFGSLGR